MSKCIYIFIALLLGFALGWFMRPSQEVVGVEQRIDTVYYAKPTPIAVSTERRTIALPRLLFAPAEPVGNSDRLPDEHFPNPAKMIDSVTLDVAIEHREFSDSTYRAVVSGPVVGELRPTLDFIETYNRTTTITVERPKRFAVTAGVGAAYTPKGFQPYVGVGVGVVIWRF